MCEAFLPAAEKLIEMKGASHALAAALAALAGCDKLEHRSLITAEKVGRHLILTIVLCE